MNKDKKIMYDAWIDDILDNVRNNVLGEYYHKYLDNPYYREVIKRMLKNSRFDKDISSSSEKPVLVFKYGNDYTVENGPYTLRFLENVYGVDKFADRNTLHMIYLFTIKHIIDTQGEENILTESNDNQEFLNKVVDRLLKESEYRIWTHSQYDYIRTKINSQYLKKIRAEIKFGLVNTWREGESEYFDMLQVQNNSLRNEPRKYEYLEDYERDQLKNIYGLTDDEMVKVVYKYYTKLYNNIYKSYLEMDEDNKVPTSEPEKWFRGDEVFEIGGRLNESYSEPKLEKIVNHFFNRIDFDDDKELVSIKDYSNNHGINTFLEYSSFCTWETLETYIPGKIMWVLEHIYGLNKKEQLEAGYSINNLIRKRLKNCELKNRYNFNNYMSDEDYKKSIDYNTNKHLNESLSSEVNKKVSFLRRITNQLIKETKYKIYREGLVMMIRINYPHVDNSQGQVYSIREIDNMRDKTFRVGVAGVNYLRNMYGLTKSESVEILNNYYITLFEDIWDSILRNQDLDHYEDDDYDSDWLSTNLNESLDSTVNHIVDKVFKNNPNLTKGDVDSIFRKKYEMNKQDADQAMVIYLSKQQSLNESVDWDKIGKVIRDPDKSQQIYTLLVGMFPNAKEVIDYNYYGDNEEPNPNDTFAEMKGFLWDIDKNIIKGPTLELASQFKIENEYKQDLEQHYNDYVEGKLDKFFRESPNDPRDITPEQYENMPPIMVMDGGVIDGNHRAFLAQKAGAKLPTFEIVSTPNTHPNAKKILSLIHPNDKDRDGIPNRLDISQQPNLNESTEEPKGMNLKFLFKVADSLIKEIEIDDYPMGKSRGFGPWSEMSTGGRGFWVGLRKHAKDTYGLTQSETEMVSDLVWDSLNSKNIHLPTHLLIDAGRLSEQHYEDWDERSREQNINLLKAKGITLLSTDYNVPFYKRIDSKEIRFLNKVADIIINQTKIETIGDVEDGDFVVISPFGKHDYTNLINEYMHGGFERHVKEIYGIGDNQMTFPTTNSLGTTDETMFLWGMYKDKLQRKHIKTMYPDLDIRDDSIIIENDLTGDERKSLLQSFEVMDTPEEIASEELGNMIKWVKTLPEELFLYRVLYLDDVNDINYDELGSHYSQDRTDLINNHYDRGSIYGDMGEHTYLITVKVPKSEVDVMETLNNNILYPHEKEITLKGKGRGATYLDIEKI
jgi:hypothetical protein